MAKKENNVKYFVGGLIIVILIISIVIVYSSKSQNKEVLTENDFKILSANWDTYRMEYSEKEGLVVHPARIEYDWDLICGCSEKPCETSAWHITVQTSEELLCENTIEGIDDNSNFEMGSGLTKVSVNTNLDVTKSHEIIVCCASPIKNGKVCDSITLPAKC